MFGTNPKLQHPKKIKYVNKKYTIRSNAAFGKKREWLCRPIPYSSGENLATI